MKTTTKIYRFLTILTVVITFSLTTCRSTDKEQDQELEAQKKRWMKEIKESFADRTSDTVLITTLLNELGTDFRRTGAFQEAIKYHYQSLQLSKNYKGTDVNTIIRNVASSYNGIGIIYNAMNDPDEAIKAYNKALEIEIEKNNLKVNRLLESRIKYETEKFTRQIEELDRQNQEQLLKRRNAILMMAPLLVVLTGLLLLILYKRKMERQQAVELKNLEKMRSNFFTNLTHELRTPITVINGLNRHLMSKAGNSCCADAKNLQAMQRQGDHLLHLVNQLLEFSRSESGIVKPKWRYGNMVEYLNVITESYTQYTRNKGIEMFVYNEKPAIPMNFVPSSMKKVMDNLLSNAIKNCTEGNRIIVHIQHNMTTQKCLIKVKDSGKGIASEDLPNIFDLYYSADSRHGQTGSGIGLALTKQLISEMGGTINVTSTPGEGAEFTVTLPISDTPIPPEEREELHYDPTEMNGAPQSDDKNNDGNFTPQSANGKKTILVIEDNKDVIHYIATILSDQYTVIHASNGNEGLLMAEQHIPDLIITDVMMPEKDGYAFTADLRNSLAISHIPVIMITAKSTTEDKLQGLRSGADAYLSKPFDERELKVRIQQLLKSRAMLMENYTATFLQESKNTVVDTDHNMTFITKLSIEVNNHLEDQQYFPDGLASDMCLSESQLNRKLKAMTGHTITSFVMRARLNKAKQLLSRRNMNITEVALTCGFSDLSYFSRSFKKVFGYTPSEFLKIPEKQEG